MSARDGDDLVADVHFEQLGRFWVDRTAPCAAAA